MYIFRSKILQEITINERVTSIISLLSKPSRLGR